MYIFLMKKFGKIENEDLDIYGYGFNNFYKQEDILNQIKIENPNKINILITHGALDGKTKEDMQYNPLSKRELKELGFDYIALGHIHKPYYKEEENQRIVYPGSTISLGFDELGNHGMIVGNIEKNKKLEIAFIPIDKTEFVEETLDISEIISKEELVEELNSMKIEENKYYKVILTGIRNFEINIYEILRLIEDKNIIKIKDNTKIKINLEEIAKEKSLKGIFVKNMLEKINQDNEEEIIRAIEIGLEAM